jgi:ubiquitin
MSDKMSHESYLQRIEDCQKTLSEISESKILGDGTQQTWACGITAHHLLTDLTEFAKAKAEGRLVVLPCKVGDTVYAVTKREIVHCKIVEFTVKENGISFVRLFSSDDRLADFQYYHFCKTVFLTREAAEQALAGGGEK